MTFGHLPYTLMMLALAGLLLFLCSSSSKLFAMIVVLSGICGFSVVSFVYSIMFDRTFFRNTNLKHKIVQENLPPQLLLHTLE